MKYIPGAAPRVLGRPPEFMQPITHLGTDRVIHRVHLVLHRDVEEVSIVTTDGNMQFGAHVAGLGAILLPG